MKKVPTMILMCIILCGMLSSCMEDGVKSVSATNLAIGTVVTITLYNSDDRSILDACFDLCFEYEKMLSRTLEDSELYNVNLQLKEHGIAEASDELCALIVDALAYSEQSFGAFDITIGSESILWDFTSDELRVPDREDIERALQYVGYENVQVNGNTITAPLGTVLDLGAIAKGYIADQIRVYLVSKGITNAIINLGGNVVCIGRRVTGEEFQIGIKKPFGTGDELSAKLKIDDCSVVTSGPYERFFIEDDILYHHILDPATGYPVNSDLNSVTIISRSSETGDALSTACFVLGKDRAMELIDSLDGIFAMFIDTNGVISFSQGCERITKAEVLS